MNQANQIVQVKIEDIVANKLQPRLIFDEEELQELAQSIKQYGIIQPLTLRPNENKYEIIAGERRYKASIIAGLKTVPAIILNVNDNTSAEIALIENIQRKNLNAIEEAKAYKKLIDINNITQEELAKKLGKSQSNIANKLRLLNLDSNIQDAVLNNKISERHARCLLKIENKNIQNEILKKIIDEKLTVKLTEDLINSQYKNLQNNEKENKEDLNKYLIGDEIKMNEQNNINNTIQQPVTTIPETPIPATTIPETTIQTPEQNNSLFTNNFFPSLEDEKTNMNLNNFDVSLNEVQQPQTSQNLNTEVSQVGINPWTVPTDNNVVNSNNVTTNSQIQPNSIDNNIQANPIDNSIQPNIPDINNQSLNQPEQILQPNIQSNQIPIPQNNIPTSDTQILNNSTINNFSDLYNSSVDNNQLNTPKIEEQSNIEVPLTPPQNNTNDFGTLNTPQVDISLNSVPNIPENNLNPPQTNPIEISQPGPEINNNIQPANTNIGTGLPGFIDPSITNLQPAPEQNKEINDITGKIRSLVTELDQSRNIIQLSEIDLENEYQITIKIKK